VTGVSRLAFDKGCGLMSVDRCQGVIRAATHLSLLLRSARTERAKGALLERVAKHSVRCTHRCVQTWLGYLPVAKQM